MNAAYDRYKILSLIYIICSYIIIVVYFGYMNILENNAIIALAFRYLQVLCACCVYIFINHLYIRKFILSRLLFWVEILMIVTIVTIWWADLLNFNDVMLKPQCIDLFEKSGESTNKLFPNFTI